MYLSRRLDKTLRADVVICSSETFLIAGENDYGNVVLRIPHK